MQKILHSFNFAFNSSWLSAHARKMRSTIPAVTLSWRYKYR